VTLTLEQRAAVMAEVERQLSEFTSFVPTAASPPIATATSPGIVQVGFTENPPIVLNNDAYQRIVLAADVACPKSASTPIPGLAAPVGAGQLWILDAHLLVTGIAGDTAGVSPWLTYSTGLAAGVAVQGCDGPLTTNAIVTAIPTPPPAQMNPLLTLDKSGGGYWVRLWLIATVGAGANPATLLQLYNASGTNPVTVKAGSYLEGIRVS
jgi:hypothetical protein